MSRPARDFHNRQAGAALVEFAIIVPLLLLLLLGIVEFSYAFFHLNILNKSVQDGALYFSEWARCTSLNDCSPNIAINVNSASNPYLINAQRLVMTGNPLDSDDDGYFDACDDTTNPPKNPPLLPLCSYYTSVNITQADVTHIQVTATYQHDFITGDAFRNIANVMFGSTGFLKSYNLTASSVMRAQ
jgi:Flp pilus assembly protein TadG